MRRDLSITKEYMPTSFLPSLPFGHSVLTTSAACRITHLKWVHLHSSYWLPSTYPTCGYQEERLLTILFPSNGLCYIVRLATLFRVIGSSGDTDGSLLSRWTALHTTSRRTAHSALDFLLYLSVETIPIYALFLPKASVTQDLIVLLRVNICARFQKKRAS